MSDVKLTDYLPESTDISEETLKDVRDRITTYLIKEFGTSIDTTANSVFGDLVLSPLSYLIASFEMAAGRLFSDLDLANVAAGTIYNCDFVQKYLENFGLSQREGTNTTGVIQIKFSTPGRYVLDSGTVFSFSDDNGEHFFEMTDVSDFLTINSNIESGEESTTNKQLNRLNDSEYVVNIPVHGNPGVTVFKNDDAKSNLSFSEISAVTAITDFDPGTLPENVMELAHKARNTYYAASLASRNGTLSFLLQTYPELQGVSPIVSGDVEMLRGGNNLFGIKYGVMDICIKSKKNLVTTTITQNLSYNTAMDKWIGELEKPQGPPVMLNSFMLSNSTEEPQLDIFSSSKNQKDYPGISASYSQNEELGMVAKISSSVAGSDPTLTHETVIPTSLGVLNVTGVAEGTLFKKASERDILISFNEYDTVAYTYLKVTVSDGEEAIVIDLVKDAADDESDGSVIYGLTPSSEYKKFLNGIDISFSLNTTNNSALDQLKDLVDSSFNETFSVTPKLISFVSEYIYDPLVNPIGELVSGSDIKPINCDIQIRSFIPCEVNNITIVYRSKSGSLVNLDQARLDIFNYVNGLSYPNLYETYAVAEIVLYHGADGVKSVTQQGDFYPSPAAFIVNDESTFNQNNLENTAAQDLINEFGYKFDPAALGSDGKPTKKISSTTLLPSNSVSGMGDRNIQYIISADNIVFDEVSF